MGGKQRYFQPIFTPPHTEKLQRQSEEHAKGTAEPEKGERKDTWEKCSCFFLSEKLGMGV
jgi:hypothetical protein